MKKDNDTIKVSSESKLQLSKCLTAFLGNIFIFLELLLIKYKSLYRDSNKLLNIFSEKVIKFFIVGLSNTIYFHFLFLLMFKKKAPRN